MLFHRAPPTPALPDLADAVALARLLKPLDHWRLFPDLRGRARFIDIETAGLELEAPITLVGVSDGLSYTVLVRGRDLCWTRLHELLSGAALLLTFNGLAFDLPRLRRAFPGLRAWDLPHFDLALLGRQVGLSGGLKAVERSLGGWRPADIADADGREAVELWHAHCRGDLAALPRLMRYCRADTESLVRLAPLIYQRLAEQDQGAAQGWIARVEPAPRARPVPPPPVPTLRIASKR